MAYAARILADSLAPCGKRLTTFEISYPRFVHSEFMTHRMFSRNSASSRAIPVEKMIERVLIDPVTPVWWGKNQAGMQAREELDGEPKVDCRETWFTARDKAVASVKTLMQIGLHKQIANRLLEPWMWITVIVSATEWENFFRLRCHPDAQPEIQKIAVTMRDLYASSAPAQLEVGAWHAPLIRDEDMEAIDTLLQLEPPPGDGAGRTRAAWALGVKVAVGRCARVSYLTHDGKRDLKADLDLHDRLMYSEHWSPFEHAARALRLPERIGNFVGWRQYRADVDPNYTG